MRKRLERRLKLWVWGHRRILEAYRRLRLFGRYLMRRPHEPDFAFLVCAAGEKDGNATLYVPVYKGTPVAPEASLRREVAQACYWISKNFESPPGDDFEIHRVPVQVRRLDALALSPDFIKIDVEGFELSVVRGLAMTIRRHQPLMLVEVPENLDEMLGLEALTGYRPFVFLPESGGLAAYTGQATTNVVLLPEGVHSSDMGRAGIEPGSYGL